MSKHIVRRVLWLLGIVYLFVGCANVARPVEQPALPLPPQYAPTALPTSTTVPTSAPTRSPVTPNPTIAAARLPTTLPKSPAFGPTLAIGIPRQAKPPVRDLAALNEYQRGIAYVAVNRDEYRSARSKQALDELFATGANYISLLVTWYQYDHQSLIMSRAPNTPTDDDLIAVIDYAHAHNVKVLLKPQINFTHDDEHWRGEIAFDTEDEWQAWFVSYREFILYYARLAQQNGVEEFAVGTELYATTTRTADWRAIIRAVRQEYTGLITYCANHSGEEMQVKFWDALDFIGVNVFYHLTNYRTPTMEQIMEGWQVPSSRLTDLHNEFPDQPIIFTEVGYPSKDLASVWPWNWQRAGALDLDEQAMLYEGMFLNWWYNPMYPWFRGLFIWNWLADPDQGGPLDTDYTPHGKPAEEILKQYFSIHSPPWLSIGN